MDDGSEKAFKTPLKPNYTLKIYYITILLQNEALC